MNTTPITIRLESADYATLEQAIADAWRALNARLPDTPSPALTASSMESLAGLARVLSWKRPNRTGETWMGITVTHDADRHAGVSLAVDPAYQRALALMLSIAGKYALEAPQSPESDDDADEIAAYRARIVPMILTMSAVLH